MLRPTHMPSRSRTPSLALACALALAACSDDGGGDDELGEGTGSETSGETGETGDSDTGGPDRDALVEELSVFGPYAVGYQELDLSYLPPGDAEERVLPVRVWYPASADSGAPAAVYSLVGIVQIPAIIAVDTPPVAGDGPFPVVVYSHGSGGDGLLAYPYAERFASHGWVVFSPSHTGNTASDAFNNNADTLLRAAVHRPLDITAVLDEADNGFAGEAVATITDMSRVFLFGHSFGGFTSLVVGGTTLDYQQFLDGCDPEDCDFLQQPDVAAAFADGFADPRVDAIAPQAPARVGFAAGQPSKLGKPTMLQSGKLDITTPDATEAEPVWATLDNPDDRWINLPYGAHYSFITVCDDLDPELLALFQPDNTMDGCGPDFTPVSELVPVLGTYLMAFARLHVLGEPQWSVLLEGESLHPEVDLYQHQ